MTRTQIYLTPTEAQGISRLASTTGRKQSEVIREAIDQYLQRLGRQDRLGRLRSANGIWKDHEGVDLVKSRSEFDRF